MSETVLVEHDGPVAIVRLNRPEKHNAMNREITQALASAFRDLDADDNVLAIVLTGAGDKAFTAGADMGERNSGLSGGAPSEPLPTGGSAFAAVIGAVKPVIAAINGYAFGGGAWLASCCDIRLASESATIRFVGASYGLVVSGPELARIVSPAVAKELIFTAKVIDAREAERIGFVNHVLPQSELLPTAVEMAKQIAANSPAAVQWAKRVIDASTTIDAGWEVDAAASKALRGTTEQTRRFKEAAERVTGRA